MISFEEALSHVKKESGPLGWITLPVAKAVGYSLATTLKAKSDAPAFDNSSVDGFGLSFKDVEQPHSREFTIRHTIHAGEAIRGSIRDGEAVKIMTGAAVPKSVAAIVMREQTVENNGVLTILKSPVVGQNIRRRGSEFKKGEALLQAGAVITPAVLGLLAGQSMESVRVSRKPSIGILISGDELRPHGAKAPLAQINDSNSPMLRAMCQALSLRDVKIIVARDNALQTGTAILKLIDRDILIAVGGVSVGDRDLVKEQLELAGVTRIFWGIDMKPGKPNYFGVRTKTKKRQLVFGLPGNPVSAAISFKKLVEPAILAMQGIVKSDLVLNAILSETVNPDRTRLEFVRTIVSTENGIVYARPLRNQGSGMLGGLAEANALIRIPAGDRAIERGTIVELELL